MRRDLKQQIHCDRSGYKFYFHFVRLYRLSTRCGTATRINLVLGKMYNNQLQPIFATVCGSSCSSFFLLHPPSFLSHFLTICVSYWDLDFSLSFSILSPSCPLLLPPWVVSCILCSSCSPYLHLSPPRSLCPPSLGVPPLLPIV